MRSPIVTASIFIAATLSPSLVAAAPVNAITHHHSESTPSTQHHPASGGGGGVGNGVTNHITTRNIPGSAAISKYHVRTELGSQRPGSASEWSISPREFWKRAIVTFNHVTKRVTDDETAGGNAHSGNSGSVNGGSVNNPDTTNNEGMPVLMNMNSNNAGTGGRSTSGCAASGKSSASGTGGNASSGDSGQATGGNVNGPPSGMVNMDSNNAGGAGQSATGCANGGNSAGST